MRRGGGTNGGAQALHELCACVHGCICLYLWHTRMKICV